MSELKQMARWYSGTFLAISGAGAIVLSAFTYGATAGLAVLGIFLLLAGVTVLFNAWAGSGP